MKITITSEPDADGSGVANWTLRLEKRDRNAKYETIGEWRGHSANPISGIHEAIDISTVIAKSQVSL